MCWRKENDKPEEFGPGDPVDKDAPETQRPIDNRVWYALSRKWVDDAENRIKTQAETLTKVVQWFFGLSTAGTVAALIISKGVIPTDRTPMIFMVSMICFLMAYAMATFAGIMFRTRFEPNNAKSIQKEFNKVNRRARFLLILACLFLFAAMGSFPLILIRSPKPTKGYVQAYVYADSLTIDPAKKDTTFYWNRIRIEAANPDSAKVLLTISQGQAYPGNTVIDTYLAKFDSTGTLVRQFNYARLGILKRENIYVTVGPVGDPAYFTILRSRGLVVKPKPK